MEEEINKRLVKNNTILNANFDHLKSAQRIPEPQRHQLHITDAPSCYWKQKKTLDTSEKKEAFNEWKEKGEVSETERNPKSKPKPNNQQAIEVVMEDHFKLYTQVWDAININSIKKQKDLEFTQ